jgi:tetrahydromethanopterin S-methyltransferase subunit G
MYVLYFNKEMKILDTFYTIGLAAGFLFGIILGLLISLCLIKEEKD